MERGKLKAMTKKFIFTVLLFAVATALKSQTSTFHSPVDYEITLAGNFGEPRPHHFHGGLDIKTDGVEGKHVYAIADGYVSRVTCGLYGFGNAVYITHPTGQTSVYCHLKSFSPRIKAAMRRYQYEHETSVPDVRLTPLDVPVSQGQFIALSGNTGHSTAPHLHLEIHDTRSWDMLDPYEYLSDYICDTVPPRAHGFMACPQDGLSRFNGGKSKQTFGFPPSAGPTGEPSFTAWGRVGFALWADDYMQGSYNHYGVRKMRLLVDGNEVFRSETDRIPVALNRMVNSWGDYDHWLHRHAWYMRSYIEPGNTLPILYADQRRGIVDFSEERDYHLEYILSDYKGNESRYTFAVRGQKPSGLSEAEPRREDAEAEATGEHFHWNQANSYSTPGMQLIVPPGLLTTNVVLHPTIKVKDEIDALSDVYCFHDRSLPLVSDATVSLHVQCPVEDPSKLYVVSNGKYQGGDYSNGWVTGKIRDLGIACQLAYDDEAPQVKVLGLSQRLLLSVYDRQSGVSSWSATVDGRFVVFDAVEKSSNYVCDLSESWLPKTGTSHKLKFTATDNCQNTCTFETTFVY